MEFVFVTGSGAAFFNSMLVGVQALAERIPGRRLLVCDFGFTGAQAEFLRGLGVLLERPPAAAWQALLPAAQRLSVSAGVRRLRR